MELLVPLCEMICTIQFNSLTYSQIYQIVFTVCGNPIQLKHNHKNISIWFGCADSAILLRTRFLFFFSQISFPLLACLPLQFHSQIYFTNIIYIYHQLHFPNLFHHSSHLFRIQDTSSPLSSPPSLSSVE